MRYADGLISWADLVIPDVDAAKAFYSGLMAWDAEDQFAAGQRVYTLFRSGGQTAAGLAKQSDQMQEQGIPPLWTTYVNVADVDAVAAAFTEHGGQLIAPPMDIAESGRMAYGMDPTGAAIGLWQPNLHQGADEFNDPGFMTWNELATRDVEGAVEFYEGILPWRFEKSVYDGGIYYMITVDGRPTGGAMVMGEDWPDVVPPFWMVYFRVGDIAAAISRVPEMGGTVTAGPFDTPQGKAAVVRDPQGGMFSIIGPSLAG